MLSRSQQLGHRNGEVRSVMRISSLVPQCGHFAWPLLIKPPSTPWEEDRGWRRPRLFGVCDFPKGLAGAEAHPSRSMAKIDASCKK